MKNLLGAVSFVCVLAIAAPMVFGQSIGFTRGQTPPADWDVWQAETAYLYDGGTIEFSGPLMDVYSNDCTAAMWGGGSLEMAIDHEARRIEIYFEPPAPFACIALYDPVCGVEGDFGPLAAGRWTLYAQTWILDVSETFLVYPDGALPGDADSDGDVDLDDFVILKTNFGRNDIACDWAGADFDGDSDVDLDDFAILKNHFGVTQTP